MVHSRRFLIRMGAFLGAVLLVVAILHSGLIHAEAAAIDRDDIAFDASKMVDIRNDALTGARSSLAGDIHIPGGHFRDQALIFLVIGQHQSALHIDRNPLKGSLIVARRIPCQLVWPRGLGWLE